MIIKILISWMFPVIVILYLVSIMKLISDVRRNNEEYWKSIGNPDLWGVNGQAIILKKIFLAGHFPEKIAERYKARLRGVRVLAFLGLVNFLIILSMIWLGMFEP